MEKMVHRKKKTQVRTRSGNNFFQFSISKNKEKWFEVSIAETCEACFISIVNV